MEGIKGKKIVWIGNKKRARSRHDGLQPFTWFPIMSNYPSRRPPERPQVNREGIEKLFSIRRLVDLRPVEGEKRNGNKLERLGLKYGKVAITLVLPETDAWDMATSVCDDARRLSDCFIARVVGSSAGACSTNGIVDSTSSRQTTECRICMDDDPVCCFEHKTNIGFRATFPFINNRLPFDVNLDELYEASGGQPDLKPGDEIGTVNFGGKSWILRCQVQSGGESGYILLTREGNTARSWKERNISCDKVREFWKEIKKWE